MGFQDLESIFSFLMPKISKSSHLYLLPRPTKESVQDIFEVIHPLISSTKFVGTLMMNSHFNLSKALSKSILRPNRTSSRPYFSD